jgi:hypothetical protein
MSRISAAALAVAIVVSVTTWLFAAAHTGTAAEVPATGGPGTLTVSEAVRAALLMRAPARLWPGTGLNRGAIDQWDYYGRGSEPLPCHLLAADPPSGTSPKFTCVLPGGAVVKVKYGHNPEIQAEAAATHLLDALGFAADAVNVVPALRCYGCSRFPFTAARLHAVPGLGHLFPARYDGYTDFTRVAVEQRFPAPAIETADTSGWAWWELKASTADRASLDALRLLALFLAHWDNKAENQRLVCLDDTAANDSANGCVQPLVMIQDLGATFGPYKANLHAWKEARIWRDPETCVASMRTLPFGGSTFSDVRISEGGRQQLLSQLHALTDADIRRLFANAAFPAYQSTTDDGRDLDAWARVFRMRVRMIEAAGPCD